MHRRESDYVPAHLTFRMALRIDSIISIFSASKGRHREVKGLSQDHTANNDRTGT